MKTILGVALICLLVTSAYAEGSLNDVCKSYGVAAYGIMQGRQNGEDMEKYLTRAEDQPAGAKKAIRSMIIEAYRAHRYQGNRMKEQKAQEFRTKWQLACLDGEI